MPGVPIAVARPGWQVALIESSQKKAAFLQQVKIELELNNVYVFPGRAEDYLPAKNFDIVISRALSSLQKFVVLAGHLCDDSSNDSRLVAMKGAKPEGERSQLPANFFVEKILPITVPGLNAKRQLVIINKKT